MTLYYIFFVMDIVGTISFATSGSLIGVKKCADIFGVVFLGVVTAVGGGIIRDMMIRTTPPHVFNHPFTLLCAVMSSLFVFFLVRFGKEKFLQKEEILDKINNIFDAIGLASFTITGVQDILLSQYSENVVLAVFAGMICGVGGGMIRDILVGEMPFILRKRIYAVASIVGACIYYVFIKLNINSSFSATFCCLMIILIRMISARKRWNLPKAI